MDDENLERYLAEFQPRPVRALEIPRSIGRVQLWWIAAAATISLGGGVLWNLLTEMRGAKDAAGVAQVRLAPGSGQSSLNVIALTRLALEDEEQFEVLLVETSRTALPSFEGENSMLRVLAKE